ncbi:glycosyltransferase [Paenibacillus sp. FSL W8-0186]|uniref:Glycosyl transferase family 2 n=1 Tax=Paenibacillus woosongensis TaxID=307580 RepID=A0ABQ4MMS7_9BACL|nr:glycosyltransferase [Paenibacillus woosongensis]GIP57298.1 glycosyl transferase family 2 [Paenibacillus woosongensis]
MSAKVSIIIPFYNCPYIEQAVSSALAQTYSNIEIIVVDDGSTSYAELLAPYRHRIHYLGKQNGGTATALNHGIRHASGDYIAWLSSDDIFYPEKISIQLHEMLRHKAVISHTNFNYIDESGTVTQFGAGALPMTRRELLEILTRGNPINGCTVMIKRSLLKRVGLFDERLPYTHDYDLWCRILLAGYSFHYVNQPLIAYRRHPGMGTIRHESSIVQEIASVRSRYRRPFHRLIHRHRDV